MRPSTLPSALFATSTLFFILAGCMTPERATREADQTAVALATAAWQEQTGCTNTFDIARPADALTLNIALAALQQGVTNTVFPRIEGISPLTPSNGLVRLTLTDALRLGARHSRRYQTLKESVYQRALSLDTARYNYDNTFSGFILGALSGSPEINRETGNGGAGFSRKFENGASLVGNMALDVAKMIREDWHSFGWSGDLTASIPLLRGSTREIVREPLTQSERSLAYAILTFERFRQTFALSVIQSYYNVLKLAQNRRNSDDNEKRLKLNFQRAEMMFKAGRMDRIQMDQAKTDLLSAQQTIISTQKSYEDALDSFKMTLGFPPEAPIALDDAELRRLQDQMAQLAEQQPDALSDFPDEVTALATALDERCDLAVIRGELADAERAVKVSADALRADLTLEGGAGYNAGKDSRRDNVDDTTTTSLKVRLSAPWDRRRERNAYRRALISLAQSQRSYDEAEDNVKNEVRAGYRELVAARATYQNAIESFKVAQMRAKSIELFMQSGRSSMRDILESESSLLNARNSLCSQIVSWHMSDLTLRSKMGIFNVALDGSLPSAAAGADDAETNLFQLQ